MTNLTLSIDDDLLKQARIRALERNTSVNALVRDYVQCLVAGSSRRSGMERFVTLAEASHAGRGARGRRWTRDDLHER